MVKDDDFITKHLTWFEELWAIAEDLGQLRGDGDERGFLSIAEAAGLRLRLRSSRPYRCHLFHAALVCFVLNAAGGCC